MTQGYGINYFSIILHKSYYYKKVLISRSYFIKKKLTQPGCHFCTASHSLTKPKDGSYFLYCVYKNIRF